MQTQTQTQIQTQIQTHATNNRSAKINLFQYGKREERLNFISHLMGLFLSIACSIFLIVQVIARDIEINKSVFFFNISLFSCLVYSLTAMLLFFSSASYHYVTDAKKKYWFKLMDHVSIYMFIAGTYTPIVLIGMKTKLSFTLLAVVWSLVFFGIIYELIFLGKNKYVSTACYLILGNISLFLINEMIATLTKNALTYLLVGGVFYSVGSIFYVLKKIPYTHMIWHFFVVAGFIFHFLSVYSCLSR
ncbi:MAG: hemolysin III family protein [Oligoflexia bacterium]|nr:hemolysin III family protein [Oligoflexia bacterium]